MKVIKRGDIHHTLKIRQHCYYNKAITIPQAVEGGKMSGISRFERYILLISAGTLLFTAGWFAARHFMVTPYTIVVEKKEQETDSLPVTEDETQKQPESMLEGEKININTASIYELDRLPNIGPSKAEAIVTYRTEHGAFERIEELMDVSGIGEATFEELKEYVTVAAENQ